MRLDEVAASPHFREHAALAEREVVDLVGVLPLDPVELAALVEDPGVPQATRLAVGTVLAVLGDPRVGLVPRTCRIPAARARIGLEESDVDGVVAQWAHVGVEADWIRKESPPHSVLLAEFWLATYPVTNGEYRDFLAATDYPTRPTTWYLGAYPADRANHPVCGVGAEDADAYAHWLTARTGHPWRLPTEAEWEYAAAGPEGLEFPWGNKFDPSAANTRETGIHTTTPVGAFPTGRSPFGILDMAGNVEEYVADTYTPYPGGPYVADHLVQTMTEYRVARGGSFSRFGDLTRTRRRHGAFPGPLYPVGFRLATSVQAP
ncbi:formylglycine-generating enzyme family protein [Actinokineospora diospyrosa]|uniref:Formylglycine-generating enzyme, required for sulfatase activity, contains SUMF1/FGE domain n=1 Tax=Actinokineospora diospyrosa TaxID=103728 RepID=A0ABT1IJ87_9PSEU|nr:SUMF1/EgtB/PvdO family nonheme iron enzyme [Actinokineospora diospyrosa]MCP2272709.1 Formylglycine-generating enzyme, required for sulfatase activity, contains SUMF1/FGE domain [Actinokineospora diospyrosa]